MAFVPQPQVTKSYTKPKDIMIGFLWSIQEKGDIAALPSMNEVFYGLYSFIANFLKEKMLNMNGKRIWIE